VLHALGVIAERHGTNLGAVALAWVSAQPGVTAPVVSTRTPEQLAQLLEMQNLQLTDDDLTRLSAVSSPSADGSEPAPA
jgi:aryl-alcohol dehydrogenase-like predicted oxidoreductase